MSVGVPFSGKNYGMMTQGNFPAIGQNLPLFSSKWRWKFNCKECASKVRYRVHKIWFCIFQKIIHSIFTLFGNLPYYLLYLSLKANFIINGINRYRWTCKSEFSHPLEKLYQLFTYRHKYTCLKILCRTFFIKIPWKIFML